MFSHYRYHLPLLIVVISYLVILTSSATAAMALNLTPEQIATLDSVIRDLSQKQFKIVSDIERTLLELKLELMREDRFATEAKAAEGARRANTLIKQLTGLYGDMLRLEVTYVLKVKDVLTREQRMQLIESLDFDMDFPEGWMQEREIEVLAVDLELTDQQLQKILGYRTQMQKKEAQIEKKMETLLDDLEQELSKDTVDDQKVNKIVLSLTDQGIELLNNRIHHRLKAKDVLSVEQKKELLHALFIAAGF